MFYILTHFAFIFSFKFGNLICSFSPTGYRMVQPNVAWGVPGGVPGVTTAAGAATNGSATQPQMMYSAAMPQYQTQ